MQFGAKLESFCRLKLVSKHKGDLILRSCSLKTCKKQWQRVMIAPTRSTTPKGNRAKTIVWKEEVQSNDLITLDNVNARGSE